MTQSKELVTFSENQVDLIKRTIAVGATDDELQLFLHQCKRTGLDPLSRQIHFQKFRTKDGEGKVSIITSIDGYRLMAVRTGEYAGSDEPIFDKEDGIPGKATITVYRMIRGVKTPFSASARWSEYCPPPGRDHMWKKMPFLMLGKCAEALALRKAFPNDLSGLHIQEEMDQAVLDKIEMPTERGFNPQNMKHLEILYADVKKKGLELGDGEFKELAQSMRGKTAEEMKKALEAF
jgi:phage recombination protein Bet